MGACAVCFADPEPKYEAGRERASKQQALANGQLDKTERKQRQKQSKQLKRYQARFPQRVTVKYEVKALIGKGSFSRVFRAEHKQTRQPYAVKAIDAKRGKDLCESELKVLQRVKHRYIIQLIEVFETPEKIYMVLELATGGELFERILQGGHFTETDAARVIRMVLDALKYLHSLGICHRDLKPENILFYHPGVDSKVMITDFGLSGVCNFGEGQLLWTTCGTPDYISPELLARKPYNTQVDLWATGVITYVLLSGTLPFEDENRKRMYRKVIKADYSYRDEHWNHISTDAKCFIDELLVVNPEQRLTAVNSLKHPWLAFAAAKPMMGQKNLYKALSKNLSRRRSSGHIVGTNVRVGEQRSGRNAHSAKAGASRGGRKQQQRSGSAKSRTSLKSERTRVSSKEVATLHKDKRFRRELSELSGCCSARPLSRHPAVQGTSRGKVGAEPSQAVL